MSKRRTGGRASTDRVHSITSTQAPLGEDIDRRARRYLQQMALRTVCFLAAVFTWGRVPTWLSVTLLVGAVILPYVAVVLANAGRERPQRADSLMELREIAGAPTVTPLDSTRTTPVGTPLDTPLDTAWSDPPWDDPQWRDARRDDPTGPAWPDGAGRG